MLPITHTFQAIGPSGLPYLGRKQAGPSRKHTVSPQAVKAVTFGAANSDMDPVHLVGIYPPGSGYLAEVQTMFTGVYQFTRRLRGKSQLDGLPLIWQKQYPKTFHPLFSTVNVPHYDLERSAFAGMQLRQPRENNSVFMSFNQQRGSNDRTRYCLIATPKNGTYIAPPNSTMSAVQAMLAENHIPSQAYLLDLDKVDRFLSAYQNTSPPSVNLGWAGRDIYAVVTGALSAGLDPRTFADDTQPVVLPPLPLFMASIQTTSKQALQVGQSMPCKMMFDLDGPGDLKLGWAMSKPDVTRLIAQNPLFRVAYKGRTVDNVSLRAKYQEAVDQEAVLISSSTHALNPNQYLFELGIRNGNIADKLGITAENDQSAIREITITRTR